MKSNLVKVSALIAGLSIATATVSVTKVAEALPQDSKLQFVQDTQSDTQPEVIKEQTGKLKIFNNTPFIALVQLYQPNVEQPYRYVNVLPCSERSLFDTYSNLWQVSFNDQRKRPVYEVSEKRGNNFAVITSKLNTDTKRTCEYKPIAQDIISLPFGKAFEELVKEMSEILKKKAFKSNSVGDLSGEASRVLTKAWLNIIDSLAPGATINARNPIVQELLLNPTQSKLVKLNQYMSQLNPNHRAIDEKTYLEVSQNATTYYTKLDPQYIASLDRSTLPEFQRTTVPISQGQGVIDESARASSNGASTFGITASSTMSKNDVFRVSSIIDFSKWYASYRYQSKPESGAYNVALVSN